MRFPTRASLLVLVVFFCALAASPAAAAEVNENVPFTPAVPEPAVYIPGYTGFSKLQVQGEGGNRYVDVPFIAEYVVLIFRYALGIMVTLAMVMIVVAGIQWMTAAGNAGTIQTAKTRITNAVMGLLLAFGSYTILFIINPELVNFRALRVDLVRTVDVASEMRTTREPTWAPGERGSLGLRACDEEPLPSFPECPFTLSAAVRCGAPDREERTRQFIEAASARYASEPARTRVLHIADAAVKCGVHMGSCGNTWETIVRDIAHARLVYPSGMETNSSLLRPHQEAGRACVSSGKSVSECARTSQEAAYVALRSHFGESVWPDTWADTLRPGDVFWIYNANGLTSGSVAGQHSAIFVSPAGGGRANVVNGGYGNFVSAGTICIRSSCGGLLTRIIQVE
ncbi:hypothetical protein EPO33_05260 [Patescibacteria group bacterium]|nr:MAG: hypothetical protein EPO33_05260 [Patescibacteria group bacterium]